MLLKDDPLAKWMMTHGIPVTRESYINLAYGADVPEWDAEHEGELPQEIQNWKLFRDINGELIYQEPEA